MCLEDISIVIETGEQYIIESSTPVSYSRSDQNAYYSHRVRFIFSVLVLVFYFILRIFDLALVCVCVSLWFSIVVSAFCLLSCIRISMRLCASIVCHSITTMLYVVCDSYFVIIVSPTWGTSNTEPIHPLPTHTGNVNGGIYVQVFRSMENTQYTVYICFLLRSYCVCLCVYCILLYGIHLSRLKSEALLVSCLFWLVAASVSEISQKPINSMWLIPTRFSQ